MTGTGVYQQFAIRHIDSVPTDTLIAEIRKRHISPEDIDINWGECRWCSKKWPASPGGYIAPVG